MPARTIEADGKTWTVYPSGFVTQYDEDEFGLFFVSDEHGRREVRVTRYSPTGARSRDASFAELDAAALRTLFESSQPSFTSPEAGYRR